MFRRDSVAGKEVADAAAQVALSQLRPGGLAALAEALFRPEQDPTLALPNSRIAMAKAMKAMKAAKAMKAMKAHKAMKA